jgi:hypothetical protein
MNNNTNNKDSNPIFKDDDTKSFQSMIIFNDNLRKNIKLSLIIYKQLFNFNHNYIHTVINEASSK